MLPILNQLRVIIAVPAAAAAPTGGLSAAVVALALFVLKDLVLAR